MRNLTKCCIDVENSFKKTCRKWAREVKGRGERKGVLCIFCFKWAFKCTIMEQFKQCCSAFQWRERTRLHSSLRSTSNFQPYLACSLGLSFVYSFSAPTLLAIVDCCMPLLVAFSLQQTYTQTHTHTRLLSHNLYLMLIALGMKCA